MGFHSSLFNSFIFLPLILSLLNISTFPYAAAQTPDYLISDVCKKTKNPNLCSRILLSNRNARKASSPLQLGEVSINLSKSGAQETKYAIDKFMRRTKDKGLKERLKTCSTNYESAKYYIETAILYWKSGDFVNVARNIAAAANEPISCRQNFGREGPAEPADVRVGNDKVETLCRVVLVISNQLSGRKFSVLEGDLA